MSEQRIQQEIRLALGRGDVRLWRNNVGSLRDQSGRMVRFGLAPGSADLIGCRRMVIGDHHVGQEVAVFCAIEVKAAGGRASPEQLAFIDVVRQLGGLSGVARSVDDATTILYPPSWQA